MSGQVRAATTHQCRQKIEDWYIWLRDKFSSTQNESFHFRNTEFEHRAMSLLSRLLEDTHWFIQTGSQILYREKSGHEAGGDETMDPSHWLDSRQQLQSAIEKWYAWLLSNPSPLLNSDDVVRIHAPVVVFHKANEWLSRTTMLNTDWFFDKGSDIVMDRWRKEDHDAYD
ncbi:hypothetical protein [Alicyclobacillus herbarius]|uniref:hypothetical protein n=1 Tax=Alicyclobacillus herbarius TaxID=122960 RepID=UPI00047EC3DC|nr:hypothetical protein [Alicyclobacillus herbarius]